MPGFHYPSDLPITARREEILAVIRSHQVVILAGETGSGKTTQLPKMCLEALPQRRGMIGCTQPRRVAALSVSRRVAEELRVTWGREVGCKMRFSDDTVRTTQIKFMTDGILLAEIQSDPLLRAYSVLILDEAHERSLNIDFLLGHLQGVLKQRPDLKLLVTSATIDTQAFSAAFGGAPVLSVSGRLHPVEIRHQPLESIPVQEDGDYVEAAALTVEEVLTETSDGDVLVFFPTERDIREARDLLEGRLGSGFEILGLFGRMPAAEQQRVFAPGAKRRVILATNVAETSITIPRIRAVVDTGLVRMSRYNSKTRTRRLPIEPISQSSANQRAGRAGRVREGLCIRLFSAEDFEMRPLFTQPEIQRANLAEVILRMKAFRLGCIEEFPFIDRPSPAAIRSGHQLLHELGALGDTHDLTPLGRDMARLPVDPTLARMLLQARRENVLPEMLIIAAGLSVPDPRERPEEAKEQAAAAHRAFASRDSDFATLLRIWNAAPDADGSRNALRRFCKTSFLSLTRMREWRDIWRQLRDSLEDASTPRVNPQDRPAGNVDAAIHRCILAGNLGHIARREERNIYKAGGNREVVIFPGSGLHERREKSRSGPPAKSEKSRQPEWIVAAEMVHTSQLFARTVARIDPAWVAELGAHLCRFRHSEPHWDARAGRVLVWQRAFVHGLEVERRRIDFGKIDPAAATQLFIRHALVDGDAVIHHSFVEHNRRLREKIETALTRVRSNRIFAVEPAFFRYYAARLTNVSSVHDLNRILREHSGSDPDFLCASEEEITGGSDITEDLSLFPNAVALDNAVLPVTYAYDPGAERDGVTVQVPLPLAPHLTSGDVQWMVPGLRAELAGVLLRALPKSLRRQLMPIEPKAAEVAAEFSPGRGDFFDSLAAFLTKRFRVEIKGADWPAGAIPTHLQPRIEIIDAARRTVAAGRELASLRTSAASHEHKSSAWELAARRWERFSLTSWSFGDLPESVEIETINGIPVLGFPGLALREGMVDVRLFRSAAEAAQASPAAVRRLSEAELGRDIAWVWKDLKSLGAATPAAPARVEHAAVRSPFQQLDLASIPLTKGKPGQPVGVESADPTTAAQEHILNAALRLDPLFPLTHSRFLALCVHVRSSLPEMVQNVRSIVAQCQQLRQKILSGKHSHPGLVQDLDRLLPPDFPAAVPACQLRHVPRFLRALQVRAERCTLSPAKDAEKARRLEPFLNLESRVLPDQRNHFPWLLEEFRVSLFAPELGTAQPVSAKRLEALLSANAVSIVG